jgi:hypothetical protein
MPSFAVSIWAFTIAGVSQLIQTYISEALAIGLLIIGFIGIIPAFIGKLYDIKKAIQKYRR